MITRIIVWTLLLFLASTMPLPFLMLFVVLYALKWSAYELIVLGVLIDGYFGFTIHEWPLYTISIVIVVIGVEFIRPRLSFYTER